VFMAPSSWDLTVSGNFDLAGSYEPSRGSYVRLLPVPAAFRVEWPVHLIITMIKWIWTLEGVKASPREGPMCASRPYL